MGNKEVDFIFFLVGHLLLECLYVERKIKVNLINKLVICSTHVYMFRRDYKQIHMHKYFMSNFNGLSFESNVGRHALSNR